MNELMISSTLNDLNLPANRPHLLTEYLPEHPHLVIQEVFAGPCRCLILQDFLKECMDDALFPELTSAAETEEQNKLKDFYKCLFQLIKAFEILNKHGQFGFTTSGPSLALSQNTADMDMQNATATDARVIIGDFCERYPLVYVRRELWCFLHAAVYHAVTYPNNYNLDEPIEWYEQVSALVEAAHVLYRNGK